MNCHPRWDGRGDPRIYGGRWRSNLCRSWAFAKMHRFAARKSRMRAVGPLVPQGRGIGQPALLALEATHVHTIPQALPAWIESTASARVLQGRRACRHIAVRTLSPPGPTGSPACVGGGLGPRAEGRDRFILRVAANALSIAAREISALPADATAHAERLAAFGVDSEQALCDAIRSGGLDGRLDELAASL